MNIINRPFLFYLIFLLPIISSFGQTENDSTSDSTNVKGPEIRSVNNGHNIGLNVFNTFSFWETGNLHYDNLGAGTFYSTCNSTD